MAGPALTTESLAAIDAAVGRAMADGRTPGLVLAIVGDDGPLAIRTYGFADLAARIPVAPEHLFEIGSIGKMFTAIAILQLAEEGRLDLHAPVATYLPWFDIPPVGDAGPIEIHHLLSHTAGIVSGVDATPEAVFQVLSLRDLVPGSAPGERGHYSNVGYKALGLMLARLEGRPYPEVIRGRVLEPLGMSATEPAITNAIRARLAVGYESREDDRIGHAGRALAPATWLETDTADGSIASTAIEMSALVRMLLREGEGPSRRLLSGDSFATLRAPHLRTGPDSAYGYGVSQRTLGERTFIGHGGGMVGYRSAVQAEPDAGIGAVVLQNGPGGDPMSLAREIVAIAAGWAPPVGTTAGRTPDAATGAPVGRWRADAPETSVLEVRLEGDAAVIDVDGIKVGLEPWGEDAWLLPDPRFDDMLLRVLRPPDGDPELWHGGRRFTREGSAPRSLPTPRPDLLPCPGRYRSHDPWVPVFRIVLRGDRLWLLFPTAGDGFDDEQPLVPLADGSFRAGDDPGGPERVRFDTELDGRMLRAWLSGWPYYRVDG